MVSVAEILSVKKENQSSEIIEEMNFYEIEIKLCEIDLERVIKKYKYNLTVMKQVKYFQNHFKKQLTTIKRIINKSRQLWLLTDHFRLEGDWKKGNLYQTIQNDLKAFRNRQTELLFEFEEFENI